MTANLLASRMHASRVLASLRLKETFISPGFYISLTAGMLSGTFLVLGFTKAVDPNGFNPQMYPAYELAVRSLAGTFGSTFARKLFAEGPFLFALYTAFLPVFLYLALGSVFRFGFEKNVGAIELVTGGPADGTAYFIAFFVKDVVLTIVSLTVLLGFFAAAAALNNLVLGPAFFTALWSILFLVIALYSYGILSSVLTSGAFSSLALFITLLLFFLGIQLGTFTIVSTQGRSLSALTARFFNWFSPFFYWRLGIIKAEINSPGGFLWSLLFQSFLAGAVLRLSHGVQKYRGVRP